MKQHDGSVEEETRHVIYPKPGATRDAAAAPHCLNCEAALTGQYCWRCGQRARDRLISLWELLKDAFGDLFDADSRLWRTLLKIAFRPGWLTRDYLRGRRARYMPPFRTYLVLSLLFFVVAFFDPREELGILFEPAETPQTAPAADAPRSSPQFRVSVDADGEEQVCDLSDYNPAELPGFLGRRLSRERVQTVCERLSAEDGQGWRGFLDRLLEFVPAGLFLLLPLMALALKILYPLSRRYYVEHLLLVVHYHAFVFLAMTIQLVLSRVGVSLGLSDGWMRALLIPLLIYVPVYLYKTLRRVYTQGHWLTTLKFLLLVSAYAGGLFAIFATMAIVAAFSA